MPASLHHFQWQPSKSSAMVKGKKMLTMKTFNKMTIHQQGVMEILARLDTFGHFGLRLKFLFVRL